MNLKFYHLSALLLGATLLGCGPSSDANQLPTHEVSGKVLMKGSPVADATVTFSPVGEQPVAFGRTDAEGAFTLTTYESGDGAVAGSYKVLVSKSEPGSVTTPGHDPNNPTAHTAAGHAAGRKTSLLPAQYASAANTTLTADVTEAGENVFAFELE